MAGGGLSPRPTDNPPYRAFSRAGGLTAQLRKRAAKASAGKGRPKK